MTFVKAYRINEKFHCDPYGIYLFSGPEDDCSITALDTTDDSGTILPSLCNFLNGDIPYFQPKISKVEKGRIILETGDEIRVRGWGYLTGLSEDCLKLDDETAAKIQDQFFSWLVLKIMSQDDDKYSWNK